MTATAPNNCTERNTTSNRANKSTKNNRGNNPSDKESRMGLAMERNNQVPVLLSAERSARKLDRQAVAVDWLASDARHIARDPAADSASPALRRLEHPSR